MTPRRRAALALALMAATWAAAGAWTPTRLLADARPPVELETMFPRAFDDWALDDRVPLQLVSPDQAAVLDKLYNQTLSRVYRRRDGATIMLSVAYGGDQSDGTRAHRPEVCYPAQGFQILANQAGTLALAGPGALPVRRLVARQGGRIEPITYWITVGDAVATSGTAQKLAQLRYGVRGVVPDGLLMRVSSIDADPVRAHALQAEFTRALRAALAPGDRPLVFGAVGGAP